MNHELKKEILSLLESPELREYLMAPPEKLRCTQYAEIICGAPVSLYRKQELLLRLKAETPEDEMWAVLGDLRCLEDALRALEQAEAPGIRLSVELVGYDEGDRSMDTLDGPFPVRNLAEAQQAMCAYRTECDNCDWSSQFWTMELYDLARFCGQDGFCRPAYAYVLSPEGEPQFFTPQRIGPGRKARFARAFGRSDLNVPAPYKPGDILCIDCRPYTPLPFYCLLLQVRSGCCGMWCLFPNLDGSIGQGALIHGHYYAQEYDFAMSGYLSPLYRARPFTGELPENCRFMKRLSKKIHADPAYGDKIDEVICNLEL